jgi:hypothetical protein
MTSNRKHRLGAFKDRRIKPIAEREKEYKAYPDVPAPWTTGFFFTLFGRYGKGAFLWALGGIAAAILLWWIAVRLLS